jgi:hypothetical protein
MNKKVTLVISHEDSGSTDLCRILDKNSRVQWCKVDVIYDHPIKLQSILAIPHKLNNAAAIWLDELLYNHYFTHKRLYEMCRFIYVIRDAKSSKSVKYYTYRLRRICEMARCTPGAVLLTYDDIITGRCNPLLEDYLCLKEPLIIDKSLFSVPSFYVDSYAQESYERYLYYLKQFNLRRVNH